jgi:hypothetical protein
MYKFTDSDYEAIVKAVRGENNGWRDVRFNSLHERLTLELDKPNVLISIDRYVRGEQDCVGDGYFDVRGEVYEVTSFEFFDAEDNDIPSNFDGKRLAGMLSWGHGVVKNV